MYICAINISDINTYLIMYIDNMYERSEYPSFSPAGPADIFVNEQAQLLISRIHIILYLYVSVPVTTYIKFSVLQKFH